MTLSPAFHSSAATLITPECEAPGCSVDGDQYTLVHPAPRTLAGLAYYQGICVPCQQARQRTHH